MGEHEAFSIDLDVVNGLIKKPYDHLEDVIFKAESY